MRRGKRRRRSKRDTATVVQVWSPQQDTNGTRHRVMVEGMPVLDEDYSQTPESWREVWGIE